MVQFLAHWRSRYIVILINCLCTTLHHTLVLRAGQSGQCFSPRDSVGTRSIHPELEVRLVAELHSRFFTIVPVPQSGWVLSVSPYTEEFD